MKSHTRTPVIDDPGLRQIADLERDILRAHDERMTFHGITMEEAAAERLVVAATARAIADRLRAEHLARTR